MVVRFAAIRLCASSLFRCVYSLVLPIILQATLCAPSGAQTWTSSMVYPGNDGRLVYDVDNDGNRIPDFSHAGFRNGNETLPGIPTVRTTGPVPGDNTAHLQSQIAAMTSLPIGNDGFRGALELAPGIYRIEGTVRLHVPGVVLRGAGEGEDSVSNTILLATGDSPHQRTVVVLGGSSQTRWRDERSGTRRDIVTDTVYVGSRTFDISDASGYAVGDNIIIVHPCTVEWLAAVDFGGTATDAGRTVNEQPIVFNRFITGISGNRITIDAPVFNHLLRSLSQSYTYLYARQGLQTNIGIEDVRIDIETTGVTTDPNGNEDHAWDAVLFQQIEDAWARRVTTLHFGQSGFKTATATRVTIESCSALDPVGIITGERRYNFNTYTASQLILFKDCLATRGRHDFVSNGTSWVSGIVFTRCISRFTNSSTEGHRRWSQGILYDNVAFEQPSASTVMGLYNRGDAGTGHGWAAAHSVAWNIHGSTKKIVIQKPPTAQNYAIGCTGFITGAGPFSHPAGFIEPPGIGTLVPGSLYEAQLADRLALATGIDRPETLSDEPVDFALEAPYPNPFNPATIIRFTLTRTTDIRITVNDMLGRPVSNLADGIFGPGTYVRRWEPTGVAGGIYFIRLTAGLSESVRKVVFTQ